MLVSSVASADPPKPSAAPAGSAPAASASAASAAAAHGDKKDTKAEDDDDDEMGAADGGKAVAGHRTPAQMAFRKELWKRREDAVEARVHKGGKHLTDEEREVIKAHWHRVSRLMRIRELAQEDKADALVKRVDAALQREEKNTDSKLDKLSAKAAGGAK